MAYRISDEEYFATEWDHHIEAHVTEQEIMARELEPEPRPYRYPSTIKNDIAAELQRHPSEIDWKLLRELIDELEAVMT